MKFLNLITEVRLNKVLYDMSDPNYHDSDLKMRTWESLAEKLSFHGGATELKKKWYGLRTVYWRKKKKLLSGSGAKKTSKKTSKKWLYFDEMEFIDPFIKDREERTLNVSSLSFTQDALDDANSADSKYIILNKSDEDGDDRSSIPPQVNAQPVESPAPTPSTEFAIPMLMTTSTESVHEQCRKHRAANENTATAPIDSQQTCTNLNRHEKASSSEVTPHLGTALESGVAALAQSGAPLAMGENERFLQALAVELSHLTEYQQAMVKPQMFSLVVNVRFGQQGQFGAPSHSQDLASFGQQGQFSAPSPSEDPWFTSL